ncbi:uncharacterized protein PAC_17724 [Phialocephala subalpina]|uniref:Uncharacterized protein n=1 Tax=Phialocephala subalpina TaxID=576137 RepID=A0A1L7XS47_9HELO|nr:uncharacterized protein PAC_17724 [Phialocephala subalpina]
MYMNTMEILCALKKSASYYLKAKFFLSYQPLWSPKTSTWRQSVKKALPIQHQPNFPSPPYLPLPQRHTTNKIPSKASPPSTSFTPLSSLFESLECPKTYGTSSSPLLSKVLELEMLTPRSWIGHSSEKTSSASSQNSSSASARIFHPLYLQPPRITTPQLDQNPDSSTLGEIPSPSHPTTPQFNAPNLHLPSNISTIDFTNEVRLSIHRKVSIFLSLIRNLNTYHAFAIHELQEQYPGANPGGLDHITDLISHSIGLCTPSLSIVLGFLYIHTRIQERFWEIFENLEELGLVDVEGLVEEMALLPEGEEIDEDLEVIAEFGGKPS